MKIVPFSNFTARSAKRRRNILAYTIIVATIFTYFVPGSQIQSLRRISVVSDDCRPIMHTFYEKVSAGEDDLLEAWKEEWSIAGFKTVVLNIKDAKKHPYFEEFERIISHLFDNHKTHDMYNQMCYYRWLAMAASGGGWMCDYDTFPTNFPMDEAKNLPNGGNFTSFEMHVPSLMAGSADEWLRLSKLLLEAIPKITEDVKSDMYAFLVIRNEATHDVDFRQPVRDNMAYGFPYKKAFTAGSPREVDCRWMGFGKAIHFAHSYSHDSYDEGKFPVNVTSVKEAVTQNRGKAARIFMSDWRKQCGGSNVRFPMRRLVQLWRDN